MRLSCHLYRFTSASVSFCAVLFLASSALFSSTATAATLTYDATSAHYGTLEDGPASTVNGVTYLNQSLPIRGVTANSKGWALDSYAQPTVTLRRGGYAPTDDFGNYSNRDVVSSERLAGDLETTVRASLPTTAEDLLNQNNILAAIDNISVNAGYIEGIQTDIERADFIFEKKVAVSSDLAIALFERGPGTAHDAFKVASVLSVDADGNPTSYGALQSIEAGWGQSNLRPGGSNDDNLPYSVLTNSGGDFKNVLGVEQQVGGLLIPLTELSSDDAIFGFSLFSPDTEDNGDSSNLIDWKNAAFFPQDTPNSIGGLDLVAGSGQIAAATAVPEPMTGLSLLVVGGLFVSIKRK